MTTRTVNLLLIAALSLAFVGGLQWLLNEPLLMLPREGPDADSSALVHEILLAVAFHSVVVAGVPWLLAFFRHTLCAYAALILVLSLYFLLLTGINVVGAAIAGLMLAALGYAGWSKTAHLIRHFRAR